jgi:ketosteroid isomerase-like protein
MTSPPSTPATPATARMVVRSYSRQALTSPVRLTDFEVVEFYQTQDPEVVIVETRTTGTVTTTGRSFVATSIQIFRIRDDHIALFRDFPDPRGLEEALSEPAAKS